MNAPASTTPASLAADRLSADPRIAEAKRLIAEAVAEHGGKIDRVKPAQPDLADNYAAWLDRLAKTRGAPTLWPYVAAGLGRGPFVELADGSVKLDFIGGIGVHGAGHSHPAMIEAAVDAAMEDTVMQGNLQQHRPSVLLAERLIALASASGANLDRCLLTTSGAMANENALKIVFHKMAPADRILAFDNAFAGRSLALAALTDRPNYRTGLPLTIDVDYLPFRDPHHPDRSKRWAVDELHRLLKRHPGRYAAFWAEPIAGEGGYYPGSEDFFRALCEPLREAGVPIIFDEVQSFSRTSRPFAFQHYGLDEFADVVTVGKISQTCATFWSEPFHPTAPVLSQTFTGASSMIATGIAMIDALESHGCFGDSGANIRNHQHFVAGLSRLAEQYPGKIQGPWGEGMMIAFTPGDGDLETAKSMMMRMYDAGLLGFVCGGGPTRIRFLPPPAITTTEHIDVALTMLESCLN